MRLRRFSLLCSGLLLSACGSLLPTPLPAPTLHDLGPVSGATLALPWQLGLQAGAPPWIDDGGVHYRQADDTRLAAYRDHRWAAPPSELLERRLRERLAPPPPGKPGRWLAIEIKVFEQRFATDGSATAQLGARALLFERRGGKLLASSDFALAEPAASADVQGGVAALAAVADQLAAAVLGWLAALPPQP